MLAAAAAAAASRPRRAAAKAFAEPRFSLDVPEGFQANSRSATVGTIFLAVNLQRQAVISVTPSCSFDPGWASGWWWMVFVSVSSGQVNYRDNMLDIC